MQYDSNPPFFLKEDVVDTSRIVSEKNYIDVDVTVLVINE
jgi:hypothetical protein